MAQFNSTIKDLKATFFDVFADHVSELAQMIEIIANNQAQDVIKMESDIFQRIILLNKAAGNVKSLMVDVNNLNSVKGIDLGGNVKQKSAPVVASNVAKPVEQAPQQEKMVPQAKMPVSPAVDANKAMPQQTVTSNSGGNSFPNNSTPAPLKVVNTVSPSATSVAPPSGNVVAPVSTVSDNSLPNAVNNQVLASNAGGALKKASFKFIKNSDSKVKAILVNERQYNKLKDSFVTQARSLDFGVVAKNSNVSKEKIEELMKKASALYREGKVKEAQALYAEISSMNKALKEQGEKSNVLIKKAA